MFETINGSLVGVATYRVVTGATPGSSPTTIGWTSGESTDFLGPLLPTTQATVVTDSWGPTGENITTNSSITATPASHYNTVEKVLIGIILSLIIVFAICGNTLVIVAILTDRNLRKTSNYFIVSLAVADTLVALLVMTFAVANDITGYWVFGPVFCNVWLSFDVMCSTASILNLCAISFDRYLHIRSPLHYERRMTVRRSLGAIAGLWILSALISFLPIHLGWQLNPHDNDAKKEMSNLTLSLEPAAIRDLSTPVTSDVNMTARYDQCLLALNPVYAVTSSVVSFYAPCCFMVFIYIKLYLFARMHVKNIKRTWAAGAYSQASRGSQQSTVPLSTGLGDPSRQSQYKLQDHKAAITLGVIMGTFLLCWVPFFTINIVAAFCPHCIPPLVFAIFTWLGYLNSTMNPVIYSIFNVEFREAFKRVLSFKRCRMGNACHRRDFEFGKSAIRTNGTSPGVEYGTVNSSNRKHSRDQLMSDRITSV